MHKWISENQWLVPLIGVLGVVATFAIAGAMWALGGFAVLSGLGLIALLNSLRISRLRVLALETQVRQAQESPTPRTFATSGESPAYSIRELLKGAKRISISGRTALAIFVRYSGELIEAVEDGAEIQILIVDPRSPASNSLYGQDQETYAANFRNVTIRRDHIKREVAGKQGVFEVRLMRDAPTYGIVICERAENRNSVALVQIYFMYTRIGANRPVARIDGSDIWFSVFVREFNAAWRKAEKWPRKLPSE
jgi:hypothetical protein